MTNPLEYNDGSANLPTDCKFKISPSKFSTFMDRKHNWYREQILKEEGFTYSTASVLGTIVHYCAEMAAKSEEVNISHIMSYVESFDINDDYNPEIVIDNFQIMSERLVNDYVMANIDSYLEVEPFKVCELKNGFYVGGSLDVIQGTKQDAMVVDYKTYSSKTKPRSIPMNYKYQLLVYAYVLSQLGYEVIRVRLVYVNRNIIGEVSEKTGKRLKSYPPEVTVLTEVITSEDLLFIKSLLDLCVESVEAAEKHPELRHVIFNDYRLKLEN